jgi:endoglycosylceramidase
MHKRSKMTSWLLASLLGMASLFGNSCSKEESHVEPMKVSTAPCSESAFAGSPLGTRCGYLIDEQGRVVALRGINARVQGVFDVTFSDGRQALEEIPEFTVDDAKKMREYGFDALRLPINWSGIEPTENGGFDEAYLDNVAKAVSVAKSEGLLVLLDIHQDAYSKEIGEDGAPLWAIQPPPEMLLQGPLNDLDKRRLSKQVTVAFETFFGDNEIGKQLRMRFVAMAKHVAQRFAQEPAVIGLEIYNEPTISNDDALRLYRPAFEAFQEVSSNKLFVFEPTAVRNFTDSAALADTPIGAGSVYAPHIYTFSFGDSSLDELRQSLKKDDLLRSNDNALEEARSWQTPLMITEWGYNPEGVKASEYVAWQSEIQESMHASSFYWVWKENSQGSWGFFTYDAGSQQWKERPVLVKNMARVRMMALAGWPLSQSFDRKTGVYQAKFRADPTVTANHRLGIAKILGTTSKVTCDGVPQSIPQADAYGNLELVCGQGTNSEHELIVEVAPNP